MHEYVSDAWRALARAGALEDFDAIWSLDIGWFEEMNQRRGGWSGVSRLGIAGPGDGRTGVFIKRQRNHLTRTWRHPFKGIPTFRREFDNLRLLQAIGVPSLEVLYYAERVSDGDTQAILITRELAGYRSLEDYQAIWQEQGFPERPVRQDLIRMLAGIASRMHRHRVQQNCFMPKHVFIAGLDGKLDIRLIDLEKAKRTLTVRQAMLRDLDTFNRRMPGTGMTDRLRFLLAYCGEQRFTPRVRKIWRQVAALAEKKKPVQ